MAKPKKVLKKIEKKAPKKSKALKKTVAKKRAPAVAKPPQLITIKMLNQEVSRLQKTLNKVLSNLAKLNLG